MERINSERLAILGSLHWACLQALSNEVPTPLEGLSQGARFLKLDSSTARKMRDLDVALALTRHLTSRKAEATLQQLSAAIKHSGSMRRVSAAEATFRSPDSARKKGHPAAPLTAEEKSAVEACSSGVACSNGLAAAASVAAGCIAGSWSQPLCFGIHSSAGDEQLAEQASLKLDGDLTDETYELEMNLDSEVDQLRDLWRPGWREDEQQAPDALSSGSNVSFPELPAVPRWPFDKDDLDTEENKKTGALQDTLPQDMAEQFDCPSSNVMAVKNEVMNMTKADQHTFVDSAATDHVFDALQSPQNELQFDEALRIRAEELQILMASGAQGLLSRAEELAVIARWRSLHAASAAATDAA